MRFRGAVTVVAVAALATLAFYLFQRQLSNVWLSLALGSDVRQVVDRSADDQKTLRRLDPANAAAYRKRFEQIEALRRRLTILAISRDDLSGRVQALLIGGFLLIGLSVAVFWLLSRRREERRLAAVGDALVSLSRGQRPSAADALGGRDTIGRIAAMIQTTWRQMRDDRRRIESLRDLEQWQEAARRHAHEIRTPLTAAQLELERLASRLTGADDVRAMESIRHDFDRLQAFTKEFTSFAAIGKPKTERVDARTFVEEFCSTFGTAWPQLTIQNGGGASACVAIDRDMIRRVLMNLASNAAQAMGTGAGTFVLSIEQRDDLVLLRAVDDGPGVPASVRETLFDPYVTTRGIGEGMGLGLAIARKIALDHGGDLSLAESTPGRTEFVLALPAAEAPC